MAKITPRDLFKYNADGSIPASGGRAVLRRKTAWKRLPSQVSVIRTGGTGNKAFEACVVIGGSKWNSRQTKRASGYTTSCMHGRNPRLALKSALARASRQMGKRSGAFARFSGGRR